MIINNFIIVFIIGVIKKSYKHSLNTYISFVITNRKYNKTRPPSIFSITNLLDSSINPNKNPTV